jgi:hypothetical protein
MFIPRRIKADLILCTHIYRSRLADLPVYTIPGFLPVMLVHSGPILYYGFKFFKGK